MKKINYFKIAITLTVIIGMISSCTKKLDLVPTNSITAQQVYSTPLGYLQSLAKCYAAFANTGNVGGTGSADIPPEIIKDEGNSDFMRLYWNTQELTTDEAVWSWSSDAGIVGLHEMNWSAINPIIDGLYYRSFFQITLCNDFIRQASDANLSSKGFAAADVAAIKQYRAEARFLRAYQYWVLMDSYANPPFADENLAIGTALPKQINRADLFNYIESELLAIIPDLLAPHQSMSVANYAHADQAAAWALLARMYLNAQVYTGTARYTDAITYCNKIITAGYTLHQKTSGGYTSYGQLMLADNNKNSDEFIFAISYDGKNIQNYGGTTYLTHGPTALPQNISGVSSNWGGLRTTPNFVALFTSDPTENSGDTRPLFYTPGQNLNMTSGLYIQGNGYSVYKYRNFNRDSTFGTGDPTHNFSDVDFPIFRLAEIYLTYAEAVLRGGTGGDAATALNYINLLRARAYGNASGNITAGQLTTDFILNERGRELYWEALRRTDLVRYGKFTSNNYLWAWKGGVLAGTPVSNIYNIFPIPSTDLSSNPNLVQNSGY